jgi:Bacterial membrane protein YfhO
MAARRTDRRAARGPWLLVFAVVAWNLVSLRAATLGVAYLDDSSVHEQMVRFATAQLRVGRLPLTSWFPYLGLGSPQFLHYQSLPAMLTGLVGIVTGPDAAFRWSLYLLLSLWPVSVYLGVRLFGLGRLAAAAAAAMSPFLVSPTGIGYEQHAYVWTGFGVWTQLWASITLPLAWGLSWRAIRDRRHRLAAVATVALTIALHFETGYLALVPLLLWPLVAGGPLLRRLGRAALVGGGALLVAAWAIVPLIEQRAWAARNELLHGTALVNGYGAGRVLGWLASGGLLDYGRLPVVTALAAAGLVLAAARARTDANARALLVVLAACLLLSFGRATFGSLVDVIPGSGDIFFRRFMMGVQLAALPLAGLGAAWAAHAGWGALDRFSVRRGLGSAATAPSEGALRSLAALAAMAVVLAPAWLQLGSYARRNAAAIDAQRHADATHGALLDRLIARIKSQGGGRVYAGMPSNWGADFTVGAVPVFKYLERRDVDEVGYTLRTASLMTGPEYHFDEDDPGDYQLFRIRYLILPAGARPPVPARLARREGPYALWRLGGAGYVQIGRIVGSVTADRTDLGTHSTALLHSFLAQRGDYLRVALGRRAPPAGRLPSPGQSPPPGGVTSERDDLDRGLLTASVTMRHPGVVVLSASYDPGWKATVDGHSTPTQMVAPALVATTVPAGTHRIVFRYRGYGSYIELFALCGLTLAALLGADVTRSGRQRGCRHSLAARIPRQSRGVGDRLKTHVSCRSESRKSSRSKL